MSQGQGNRIKKEGKMKNKLVKPVQFVYGEIDPKLQFNIPKGVQDDKKIRPKDVFEGYKDPKATKKSSNPKRKKSKKK